MSSHRWNIELGNGIVFSVTVGASGRATPADSAPETEEIRAALKAAMAAEQPVIFAYGRGSTPGAERTAKPLRFLDNDLFEAVQVSPEERSFAQMYRSSCVLWLNINGRVIENPAAYQKCRPELEYRELASELNEAIFEASSRTPLRLPDRITEIGQGTYAWHYCTGERPVVLHAPSDREVAAFVKVAAAAAVDGRMGPTIAIVDAIIINRIDWPGWYQFGMHLARRVRKYEEEGGALELLEFQNEVSEIDWPRIYSPTPMEVISSQRRLFRLHDALSHVPPDIRCGYLNAVREGVVRYTPSQMLGMTFDQIASLDDFGLVEKLDLAHLLPHVPMRYMKKFLSINNLPFPPKKNRRQPFEEVLLAHEASYPEMVSYFSRELQSTFLKAPFPLTWSELHCLRKQAIWMGRLLYLHLAGLTKSMPITHRLLCGSFF